MSRSERRFRWTALGGLTYGGKAEWQPEVVVSDVPIDAPDHLVATLALAAIQSRNAGGHRHVIRRMSWHQIMM
jgi:hypothetical protein